MVEYSNKSTNNLQTVCAASNYVEIRLSVWENEGGALQSEWIEAHDHSAQLADEEKQILQRLGISVVALWGELPTSLQRMIFELATVRSRTREPIETKEQVARFLHTHRKTLLEKGWTTPFL